MYHYKAQYICAPIKNIINGMKRLLFITPKGIAKRYAMGIFTKKSFHQERGDNRYPIATKAPLINLFLIFCFLNIIQ
jgi:hypothetical protein